MFRALISPILRSIRLFLQLWYIAPTMLPTSSLEAEASSLPASNIVGALYHKL
jgi:hypothetical protein